MMPVKREVVLSMHTPLDIKICGLTNIDDAKAALDAGADLLGFILYPKSPRYITAAQLRHLLDKLPGSVHAVGVFVNANPGGIRKVASDCGLYAVQIHGDESPEGFADLLPRVWRSVHFYGGTYSPTPESWLAARYVLDAAAPGRYGGTGKTIDWNAAGRFARKFPAMLAGGLTPENVVEAIRAVRPLGVDVTSGVESSPGKKDHARLTQFISRARSVYRTEE
jgi:phosphoribosylanthranilate isomerase